jgi:hypothetical protein
VSETLTGDQIEALRWIDRNDTHESSWLRKGRLAWGDPEKWDAIRCRGPKGSIVIPVADWSAIRDLVQPGIHVLTEQGKKRLSAALTPTT